ncbi:NADH-quinone oxidoreductase subunit J [Telmatospirillum siberiense]|uniref:NADH-quinone oxidoreductase subunit J n=1 Tax=Telmatospirillum siberiense TaxID=382514 RepID=A0A2N3PZJ2_9PROT|nr:NADH-quinone oxidoreductase subunit J [Telmatospirillum siberiense]PKU25834.1 NADH-quinone oxidoreductase subunit J [Telmatospirillum siberiense]
MIQALVFYLFAAITVASAVMVISARNPVHAVLFLILAFFNAAGLFLLVGAEFLAMVLVVVYVGAVAVLFLFVVMLLDINFLKLREGFLQYLPIGGVIGLILLAELALVAGSWSFAPDAPLSVGTHVPDPTVVTNTDALGRLIYTDYFYLFQIAGLILLVAMIGTILLTLRGRTDVRRQSIAEQVARTKADSVEIRKVASGGGI